MKAVPPTIKPIMNKVNIFPVSHEGFNDFRTGVQLKINMCRVAKSNDSVMPINARNGRLNKVFTDTLRLDKGFEISLCSLLILRGGKLGTKIRTNVKHKTERRQENKYGACIPYNF